VLEEARNKVALPIFAYIVMPNHWHFVVKPKNKNQVTDFFRWEDWFYGSLWRRVYGDDDSRAILSPWPIPMPRTWIAKVNRPQSQAEEEAIRKSLKKGSPYGSKRFVSQASVRLKLEHTLRSRGRPKKV